MDIKGLHYNDELMNRSNSPVLPKSIKGLIIGKSGCGKTTLLLNLILTPGWLDYDNIFFYGKSLFQSDYKILKKALEKRLPKEFIYEIFKNSKEIFKDGVKAVDLIEESSNRIRDEDKSKIESSFFGTSEDVPDPEDLNMKKNNLMIFDDLILEKQNKCESYYTRGRHSNVDCFYLSQNYFKLPRQTIRENSNFICLFKQDLDTLNRIYNDHVKLDMNKTEFKKLCKKAWDDDYGFVTIDLTSEREKGRYRQKLDKFYLPETLPE